MEAHICDRCGEISNTVDSCGLFREVPFSWQHGPNPESSRSVLALNTEGKYKGIIYLTTVL